MVKMKMYKEREMVIHNYAMFTEEEERNSLYLVNDEVSVWINYFDDMSDLARIASHDIIELISGAASCTEYDALVWDIENEGGYEDFRGNFIKLNLTK